MTIPLTLNLVIVVFCWKVTPSLTLFVYFSQGTFLVGQPAQGSGKQGGSSSAGQASSSSPAAVTQQAIRVTAGQKAAILAQVGMGDLSEGKTLLYPVWLVEAAVVTELLTGLFLSLYLTPTPWFDTVKSYKQHLLLTD